MWGKFGSPTNHSVTNLLIEPPASSTTKLLRGNKSMGGCDNHSYYAATGTQATLLYFFLTIMKFLHLNVTKLFFSFQIGLSPLRSFQYFRSISKKYIFFLFSKTAAIIPAAARTASAHGSTSAQATQQIYGASNVVAGRSSPGTLTGTSAAALSFAAMEQMQIQNRLYSA